MLTRMTRMARMLTHMLTRMTRWLAGSQIIHTATPNLRWVFKHNHCAPAFTTKMWSWVVL